MTLFTIWIVSVANWAEKTLQKEIDMNKKIIKSQHCLKNVGGCLCMWSGAEIRSVCTEAGMFAIRARRKMATEKDFLEAVNKVIKAYAKFSATPRYMTYN